MNPPEKMAQKGATRAAYGEHTARVNQYIAECVQSGMTQEEIAASIGVVQSAIALRLRRMGIKTGQRSPRPHKCRGSAGSAWKGDAVGYRSAHARVELARGKPNHCEHCGTTDIEMRYEWASLSRNYTDTADYVRLCRPCHVKHDGFCKMSDADVLKLRQMRSEGVPVKKLAILFGISAPHASRVSRGLKRRHAARREPISPEGLAFLLEETAEAKAE